jgi:hypothetical protein
MENKMTEVPMKSETALVPLAIDLEQMIKDAELGGTLGLADISIPYLYILQTNSPQCNPDHPKYIKGATAGMLYLTQFEEVFEGREGGLTFIPCYYERVIVEWLPRETGGGLVTTHLATSDIMSKATPDDKGKPTLPNGHQLQDTAYLYNLVHMTSTNSWVQCVMPVKSTGLKAVRKMNSTIATTKIPNTDKQAPRFLYKWAVTTKREAKDQYVWSSPAFQQEDQVTMEQYNAARTFAQIAAKGILRQKIVEKDAANVVSAENRKSYMDDEVPF